MARSPSSMVWILGILERSLTSSLTGKGRTKQARTPLDQRRREKRIMSQASCKASSLSSEQSGQVPVVTKGKGSPNKLKQKPHWSGSCLKKSKSKPCLNRDKESRWVNRREFSRRDVPGASQGGSPTKITTWSGVHSDGSGRRIPFDSMRESATMACRKVDA